MIGLQLILYLLSFFDFLGIVISVYTKKYNLTSSLAVLLIVLIYLSLNL